MTTKQRQRLRQLLLAERRRVLESFEAADEPHDVAGEALDVDTERRETAELSTIDAALERLRAHPDQFGRCEVDGGEIPYARLKLVPWTTLCAWHARQLAGAP